MATHSITLNLPEALYERLSQRSKYSQRSLEEELLTILMTRIPTAELSEGMPLAYNEITEFLGRGATAQEVAEFKLSQEAQARAQTLLQKNKEGILSPAEEAELELYLELEDFMALIKIRARQQLQNGS